MSTPGTPRRDTEPRTLDYRGLACPVPVLELAKVVVTLPDGERVRVLADDPAARTDIAVWCRMKRHTLERVEDLDGWLAFDVRVGT